MKRRATRVTFTLIVMIETTKKGILKTSNKMVAPQDKAQNRGFLVFTPFVATKMIIPVLSYNIKNFGERVDELIRT